MTDNSKQEHKILTTKSAMIYGFGILGLQLFIGYMNSFQMEFYNKMYSGFDSNIFYAAAIIILVAKLISCISDPIIGSLIDRSHLKGGKMRPWILYSAFPVAIFTTIMFIFIPFENLGAQAGKGVMYAYITVTTILWNVAMSFADIPSQGMLSLLSPNVNERNVAAGIANTMKSIALAIPGVFVTIVMLVLSAITKQNDTNIEYVKQYYLITALLFLFIGTGLYLLIYFCNKEEVKSYNTKTVTMKEMFSELKNNKMIFVVFLTFILGFARNMAMGICVQAGGVLVGKIQLFGLELDPTSSATWLVGITSAVTSMVSIVVVPIINKKWGEKKTFIVFAIYGVIISLACFIFYACMPADSALRGGTAALWMIWIMQAFIGFMFGPHGYLPMIMTADIVDYQEWKTGERKEGVDFAILSMSNKISNALSVAFGILLIGVSGYTAHAQITAKMQNIVFFAYIGMPGVACLLSMIPMFWYKIDGKTKALMQKELAERRAAKENEGTEVADVSATTADAE